MQGRIIGGGSRGGSGGDRRGRSRVSIRCRGHRRGSRRVMPRRCTLRRPDCRLRSWRRQGRGTCLHRGCVPAKEFLETAAVFGRSAAGGVAASERVNRRRLRGQPGPQAAGGGPPVQGSGRVDEGPGDRCSRVAGPAPRPSGASVSRPRGRRTEITGRSRTGCGLGPPDDPRLRGRRRLVRPPTSPDLDTASGFVAVIGGGPSGASSRRCSPISVRRSPSSRPCRHPDRAATTTS